MQVALIIEMHAEEVSAWTCVACPLLVLSPADLHAWWLRNMLPVTNTELRTRRLAAS